MKHHNLLNERRVLIGLIGLLFVVGFVHTMGILSLSRSMASRVSSGSQTAQVATLSICLQITPAYNITTTGEILGWDGGPGVAQHLYWNIKNLCSTNIRILNAANLNISTPTLFTVQARNQNGSIVPILGSGLSTYGIGAYYEFVNCATCSNTWVPSTVPNSNYQISTSIIPPQATRLIDLSAVYSRSGSGSDAPIRIAPKAIKWVMESSVADNNISATDILTTPVGTTNANYWAPDFIDADNYVN